MKTIILILFSLVLAGCASSGEYRDYLTAAHKGHEMALAQQKPLVRIEAMPGQSITGLKSVEVYTPVQAPVVQQARPSEWAGVIGQGLSVVGALGGVYLGGKAATDLATSVGRSSGQGYQWINPTPVIAPSTQIVRPEVVQPAPPQIVRPEVVQVPTQVIDQPIVVPVQTSAGGV